MPKGKKIIKYDAEGGFTENEVCTGGTFDHLHDEYLGKDEQNDPHDDCPVCDKNLYYTSTITKRIAILDTEKEVTGWVCPSCYTEFDNRDSVICLMTNSAVQGKA